MSNSGYVVQKSSDSMLIRIISEFQVWLKRIKMPIIWLLVMFPIAIAANYTYRISVDVPYFDEWNLVSLVEKWHEGQGHWLDLFKPYIAYEVSYVMPLQKSAALLSAWLFHWDIRFEIITGFATLLATASVFSLYVRRIGALSSGASRITVLLPIMLLI